MASGKSKKRKTKGGEEGEAVESNFAIWMAFASVIVTGLASIADPVVGWLDQEKTAYDCAAELKKYGDLQEDFPDRKLGIDPDGELNKQCNIYEFLIGEQDGN